MEPIVTDREDLRRWAATLVRVPPFAPSKHTERPSFVPEGWAAQLRFALWGQWLLSSSLKRLGQARADLDVASRHVMQRDVAASLLDHLQVDLHIIGRELLPRQPHVVLALHESLVDGLCLLQLGAPLRFVVRDEIYRWPHIGAALANMRHLRVDPERGAAAYRTMLRAARDSLTAGEHFVVFPQGTVLGIESAFRAGAFRLAQSLRAPLLPVVLTGTHRIWEHPFSARLRYGMRVGMQILPSVEVADVVSRTPASLRESVEVEMKRAALGGALPAPRRYVPERDGYWDGYAFEVDDAFPQVRQQLARHRQSIAAGQG